MILLARPRSPCSMPCVPAVSAPTVAKRGQHTAQATASEGASPNPWQLTHVVETVGTHESRTEVWELPTRFQRMYGNACMCKQKSAAGAESSWRTSARAVQKRNVGLEP